MYYKGSMVSLFYATYNTGTFNAVRTFMGFQRERSTSTGLYVAGRPTTGNSHVPRCGNLVLSAGVYATHQQPIGEGTA